MPRSLSADLRRLNQLAFRRRAHCGPLIEKFHALAPRISALPKTEAGLIWNIYDWLLVPLSLWPIDFEGLASHLISILQGSMFDVQCSKFDVSDTTYQRPPTANSPSSSIHSLADSLIQLLRFIDPPPPPETQSVVASFEHDIESGRYEKMLKQAQKFDEQEKALLQNEQLAAEWAQLKRLFDIKQFQNSRGVIRRRLSQERGFRDPSWHFDAESSSFSSSSSISSASSAATPKSDQGRLPSPRGEGPGESEPPSAIQNQKSKIKNIDKRGPVLHSLGEGGFPFFFDAFCYRWKLYGMEHDRPLLLKISVNPTPHGTMIVIPRHWSLDPRRDLDWPLINRLHRSHGAKKQGPKLSPARTQKLDEAKQVKALREKARKLKLKGEALHEFICHQMKRDPRSDPSWWKRLLKTEH